MYGVPILLHAQRLRVVCVGGGSVAARKVAGLIAGGAVLRIVAPSIVDDLRAALTADHVTWEARPHRRDDIGDAHLVIAATDDPAVNAAVARDADAAGRLCVRVDEGAAGSAAMMAAVHRDPLVLGVATTAGVPSLTRALRLDLEDRYGPEYGELAALCAELRADATLAATLAPLDQMTRRARWRRVIRPDILDLIRAGHLDQAKEAAFACLLSSSD
ncbi:MAG: hypothetical protein KY460_06675 [Actinobacteria bacterium]|nr:hypothetical protein [Actinomycetota bacterium]